MNNKVYVGNLSWGATEQDLERSFSQYGKITDVKVVYDRETNRSRGFGFVTFETESDADAAVESMNNQQINGREVKVSIAVDRPKTERRGGYRQESRY